MATLAWQNLLVTGYQRDVEMMDKSLTILDEINDIIWLDINDLEINWMIN